MDVLQSSEEESKRSSSKIHVWNNLAFENGSGDGVGIVSERSSTAKAHFSPIKENISPCAAGTSFCSPVSSQIRPALRSNSVVENLPESVPGKCALVPIRSSSVSSFDSQEHRCDDGGGGNIDSEIESIEKEIGRLSLRLEYLRLEKAKRITAKTAAEKRGRFVPAKFMDPPPMAPEKQNPRKIDESMSAKKTVPRTRGLSMAPSEIAGGLTIAAAKTPVGRRGISLGPADIFSGTKARQFANRQEITPIYQSQSRRESCFWKLQEVDELTVMKERGKGMSLNPKSRKTSKLQGAKSKQAVTTLGAAKIKSVKKEDGFISSIEPKNLFKDGDKSVSAKKPLKCGRVVASRYKSSIGGGNGNSATQSGVRKRSLPENDKESKTCDNKPISLSEKPEAVSEIRAKKRWEVPSNNQGSVKRVSELVGRRSHFSLEEDEREGGKEENEAEASSVCQVLSFGDEEEEKMIGKYPKIRILRWTDDSSPRDSGAAKRISDLIGRKSYFDTEPEEEISVCQALSFDEEDGKKVSLLEV